MTETSNNFPGNPEDGKTLPSGINVLTILTIIGCVVFFLFSIYGFVNAKKNVDKMEETINSKEFESMPSIVKNMMSPEALALAQKQYENRVPITAIGIIGIGLCFVGALQMRKLKMQGYYLYLVGEILPFVGSIVFLGLGAVSGISGIISIAFLLLFVLLYTLQRKYLVN
jgi:hypothetical protein